MQIEHLTVTGMSCGGCTSKVTHALSSVPGVDDVNVSLADGEATVHYNERLTSVVQLKSAVNAAGYGVHGSAARAAQTKGRCCG